MIPLHRHGAPDRIFFLNPDLIHTIEATPDTVLTLEGGSHVVVLEPPETVVRLVQDWRAGILVAAAEARLAEPAAEAPEAG